MGILTSFNQIINELQSLQIKAANDGVIWAAKPLNEAMNKIGWAQAEWEKINTHNLPNKKKESE